MSGRRLSGTRAELAPGSLPSSPVAARRPSPEAEEQAPLSAGAPLDAAVRSRMSSAFGHDFTRVRVRNDAPGAAAARRLDARAFTVGSRITFAAGAYRPGTVEGDALLAHELAHVAQQEEPPTPREPVVSHDSALERDADEGAFSAVTRLWAPRASRRSPRARPRRRSGGLLLQRCGGYDRKTLEDYLAKLDATNKIEGAGNSDDKAVAIVEAWKKEGAGHVLTARRKALLILEMLDGDVSGDDQGAILDLLARSESPELDYIFGAGGVKHAKLLSEFGKRKVDLYRFYMRRFPGAYADRVGYEETEPAPPDPKKLASPDVAASGYAVQAGDPLPKDTSSLRDPLKSGQTNRRTTPLTSAEADAWIQEVYGDYLPEELKAKGGKGFVEKNVKTTVSRPSGDSDVFEEFLQHCVSLRRGACSRGDEDCRAKAIDQCRYEETITAGYYDREEKDMVVRAGRETPTTRLHEAVHAYAHEDVHDLPRFAMEGLTEYLTRQIVQKHVPKKGEARLGLGGSYAGPYQAVLELSLVVGEPLLARVHFQGAVKALCEALGKTRFDAWASHMNSRDDWQAAVDALRKPPPKGEKEGTCG